MANTKKAKRIRKNNTRKNNTRKNKSKKTRVKRGGSNETQRKPNLNGQLPILLSPRKNSTKGKGKKKGLISRFMKMRSPLRKSYFLKKKNSKSLNVLPTHEIITESKHPHLTSIHNIDKQKNRMFQLQQNSNLHKAIKFSNSLEKYRNTQARIERARGILGKNPNFIVNYTVFGKPRSSKLIQQNKILSSDFMSSTVGKGLGVGLEPLNIDTLSDMKKAAELVKETAKENLLKSFQTLKIHKTDREKFMELRDKLIHKYGNNVVDKLLPYDLSMTHPTYSEI